MACCFSPLYFFFIIFLTVPLQSNGEDEQYTACSTLYSCGQVQNIGYPFWGGNRPKFCGLPNLKLSCKDNLDQQQTTMNIISDADELDVNFDVLSIDSSSNTLVVSLDKLLDICHLEGTENLNVIPSLNPEFGLYLNISLYYGCSNCSPSRNETKSFTCANYDSTFGNAYYFGQQLDDRVMKMGKSCCKNYVRFLVDKRGLIELRRNTNDSFLPALKKWTHIKFKYKENFTACSKCELSGGRCGSSDNLTSDEFLCYCRHGTYPLVCPRSDAGVRFTERKKIILGIGIGGSALVLVALATIVFWHRKKLKLLQSDLVPQSSSLDCSELELGKGSMYFSVPLFSYKELAVATDNFDQSNELGNGGFGVVYYGKLKDGREIAVKCLYEKSYKRVEQFMNEIQILTRLRHQNLVSLYGCTSHHCKELLLVYEFIRNGTVADHLYGKKAHLQSLPWPVRFQIAVETATALSYLHSSDIIHRDVKTNNILLDSNFSVKVVDFGISRLFPTDVTHVSTAPQGTPGYLDPEYHLCYKLTDKSDVYSFGVVLIELISSLPAINMDRHKLEINLSNYAMNRIQRCAFDELVDSQLGFALDFKVRRMTTLVAELAFQCLQHDREFRPSINEVLEVLKGIESADYEALQAEETAKNAVVEDLEPIHTEEKAKNAGLKAVKLHNSNSSPSTTGEHDHELLLNRDRLYASSPVSVMNKWVSRSTTSSSSK